MDISRLKKKNLKVWLPLFDDVDVLCRHIPQSEFDAIKAAATTVEFDRRHQRVEKINDQKFRIALGHAVVEDWKGLKDDGVEFPCTPGNIEFLMTESSQFRLLVMDAPLDLERMIEAERAELEKNSETTSVQKPTTPA